MTSIKKVVREMSLTTSSSSSMIRLGLISLLLVLFLSSSSFMTPTTAITTCTTVNATRADVVNIAIFFWSATPHYNQTVHYHNPILDNYVAPSIIEKPVLQSYQLYQERIALKDGSGLGGIPMLDGTILKVNITYFCAGYVYDYVGKGPYEDNPLYSHGNFTRLANDIADGVYGDFRFMVFALQGHNALSTWMMRACERAKSCLGVIPTNGDAGSWICGGSVYGANDCPARGLRPGTRRFQYSITAASDQNYFGVGSLSFIAYKGAKRGFILAEAWAQPLVAQAVNSCQQFGITIADIQYLVPPTMVWPMNETVVTLTNKIIESQTDIIIIFSAFGYPVWSELVLYWKSINWTPPAISYNSGGFGFLPPGTKDYMLIELVFLPSLSGSGFRCVNTSTNFEVFPANETNDSPAVYTDAYMARWPGGPENFGPLSRWGYPTFAIQSMHIIQKLLEFTQSTDIELLRDAVNHISVPGILNQVQFDSYGRSVSYQYFVVQLMPNNVERIITPLGIGEAPVLPMPNWSERVFEPRFYDTIREQIMLSVTSLALIYLMIWTVWGARHWQHPVVIASAPFLSFIMILGLMMMLISNYFFTLHVNATHCAASSWLLTLGFSQTFTALLVKHYRIYHIFRNSSKSFMSGKLTIWHVGGLLISMLLIDIIINLSWYFTVGMDTRLMIVDPDRISHSYYYCNFASAVPFVAIHIAMKSLILVCALILAWRLRKVSSQFNESIFIGFCVYNVTLLFALILPLIGFDVSGHEYNFLIRGYGIIFLTTTTVTILGIPKVLSIRAAQLREQKAGYMVRPGQGAAQIQPVAKQAAGESQPPQPHPIVVHDPVHTIELMPKQSNFLQSFFNMGPAELPPQGSIAAQPHMPNHFNSVLSSSTNPLDTRGGGSYGLPDRLHPHSMIGDELRGFHPVTPAVGPVQLVQTACQILDGDSDLDELALSQLQQALTRRHVRKARSISPPLASGAGGDENRSYSNPADPVRGHASSSPSVSVPMTPPPLEGELVGVSAMNIMISTPNIDTCTNSTNSDLLAGVRSESSPTSPISPNSNPITTIQVDSNTSPTGAGHGSPVQIHF